MKEKHHRYMWVVLCAKVNGVTSFMTWWSGGRPPTTQLVWIGVVESVPRTHLVKVVVELLQSCE